MQQPSPQDQLPNQPLQTCRVEVPLVDVEQLQQCWRIVESVLRRHRELANVLEVVGLWYVRGTV